MTFPRCLGRLLGNLSSILVDADSGVSWCPRRGNRTVQEDGVPSGGSTQCQAQAAVTPHRGSTAQIVTFVRGEDVRGSDQKILIKTEMLLLNGTYTHSPLNLILRSEESPCLGRNQDVDLFQSKTCVRRSQPGLSAADAL